MFKETDLRAVKENLTKAIAEEWALLTAGTQDGYNMMTVSWGMTGELWGEDTVLVFVRPQRYTMELIDKNDAFTLSFYGDNREIHRICGSKSGRDTDKTALTGLTPVFDGNATYFEQARQVIVCKKLYVGQMDEKCFTDPSPLQNYAAGDYHYMIFGRVEKVLIRE